MYYDKQNNLLVVNEVETNEGETIFTITVCPLNDSEMVLDGDYKTRADADRAARRFAAK